MRWWKGLKPGPVVVDRDFAAELGQPVGEADRRFVVVDAGGPGDLEGAATGVGVAFVELALDELEHRDVGQRGTGEIDVEGDGVAGALALGQHLERASDHPAVELLDHPGALGDVDEGGRGQQLAVIAGHPQQQLVALDPAGGEAADRLAGEAGAGPG